MKKYIKYLSDNKKVQELLVKTIGIILLKQDNVEEFIKINNDKINHIRDWISSVIENNEQWKKPRVLTLEALNNAANKYFEKKNNKIQTIELDETHEKLIADLGNYYIIQMLSPEALDNESKVMQHCIGHGYYDENLKNENYQYLSLRDKFNKSHATLEMFKNKVLQLRGKQNKLPDEEYLFKIIEWLLNNKCDFNLSTYNYYRNEKDNKIYSLFNLPENCEINSSIYISNYYNEDLTLPKNLIINGDLDLTGLKERIKGIPEGLTVNGNLYLSGTGVRVLSQNLNIKNNIYLNNSDIEELPDNLVVNGILGLKDCEKLKKLPENLTVNDNLYLMNTHITIFPKKFKFNKSINLSNTDIEELPDNLIVNGYLDLESCKRFKKLPKGLIVNDDLNLSGTNIKYLNDKKEISILEKIKDNINYFNKDNEEYIVFNGNLNLSHTFIEELPDNLHVKGNLNLYGCDRIKTLPNNLVVDGDLYLVNKNLEKLSDNLIVNGDLELCGSKVKKLPKGLIVEKTLRLHNTEIEEIPKNIKVGKRLYIAGSKIKYLYERFECESIWINENQVDLIKETMKFRYINIIGYDGISRENFFQKYKFEKKCCLIDKKWFKI